MVRMAIITVWVVLSPSCLKVSLCFAGRFKGDLSNTGMVIARFWALLCAICPKVLLSFASSFMVRF